MEEYFFDSCYGDGEGGGQYARPLFFFSRCSIVGMRCLVICVKRYISCGGVWCWGRFSFVFFSICFFCKVGGGVRIP